MCKLCSLKPVYEFTNQRKLCSTCFIRWFEKKVLYTIRKFKMIQNKNVIGFEKKRDFRNIVLEKILKIIEERGNVKLVNIKNKKITKVAVADTLDMTSDKIVQDIINKEVNLLKYKPVEGNIIKPLYLFLDKEVLLYAKLKKLKYNKIKKPKKDKISNFIDELEKKHPEIKNAIVKGLLNIYNRDE